MVKRSSDPLPIGCNDRYLEIYRRAEELGQTFVNGNRKDLAASLAKMEGPIALAVLAVIMAECESGDRESIRRFLVEMA